MIKLLYKPASMMASLAGGMLAWKAAGLPTKTGG